MPIEREVRELAIVVVEEWNNHYAHVVVMFSEEEHKNYSLKNAYQQLTYSWHVTHREAVLGESQQ